MVPSTVKPSPAFSRARRQVSATPAAAPIPTADAVTAPSWWGCLAPADAPVPGLCPGCSLLHVPLFTDEDAPSVGVASLADAITVAVDAGARLINLSLAILGDDRGSRPQLATALDHAEASGAVVVVAAGNPGRLAMGQLLSHPATIPVVAVDGRQIVARQ